MLSSQFCHIFFINVLTAGLILSEVVRTARRNRADSRHAAERNNSAPLCSIYRERKKPLSIAVDKGFGVISNGLKPILELLLYPIFSILSMGINLKKGLFQFSLSCFESFLLV